jgi:hypothetical protein
MNSDNRAKYLKILATPAGIEPATNSLEGCCSNPLSYGAVLLSGTATLNEAQCVHWPMRLNAKLSA